MKHLASFATFAAGLCLLAVTVHSQSPDDTFGNRIDSLSAFELPSFPEPLERYGLSSADGTWTCSADLSGGFGYNSNPAQIPSATGGMYFLALPKYQAKYTWNASQSFTLLGAVEVAAYEEDLRSNSSMDSSLTGSFERKLESGLKLSLASKGNLLRVDDTSILRALRGTVEASYTPEKAKHTFLGSVFVEGRDALTAITDPRRNRDATRVGAGPSVMWKLTNSKLTIGYAHSWTAAKGSDEDLKANTLQLRWQEIAVKKNLAFEKFEFSQEARRGDHPHSRLAGGATRDDNTSKATVVIRFVADAEMDYMKLKTLTDARERWRATLVWANQESNLATSNFEAWNMSLSYNRVF